jgi:hypothetical protein
VREAFLFRTSNSYSTLDFSKVLILIASFISTSANPLLSYHRSFSDSFGSSSHGIFRKYKLATPSNNNIANEICQCKESPTKNIMNNQNDCRAIKSITGQIFQSLNTMYA